MNLALPPWMSVPSGTAGQGVNCSNESTVPAGSRTAAVWYKCQSLSSGGSSTIPKFFLCMIALNPTIMQSPAVRGSTGGGYGGCGGSGGSGGSGGRGGSCGSVGVFGGGGGESLPTVNCPGHACGFTISQYQLEGCAIAARSSEGVPDVVPA
eukprot:3617251-Prymnesium_polylepis.2